ncbi:MAG: STAS domain-containing protein [Armatimonadetes bacterium]|nr:STAS domain-containing protein [Armatimonadota bacterium]
MDNAFIRVHSGELQGVPLLEISGDIDLSTLPHLQRALEGALNKKPQRLIIDLRKVSFVDSSGVGALIGAKKKLMTRHGELYIICGEDHVRRKLGLMRLGNIMRLHSTPEEVCECIKEEQTPS